MPDSADDRDLRCRDGAHHRLLIEGPQILNRAAAAPNDQKICQVISLKEIDRMHDLPCGLLPLHLHRIQDELHALVPPPRHRDDIMHRSP